jgi:hypothetical protein
LQAAWTILMQDLGLSRLSKHSLAGFPACGFAWMGDVTTHLVEVHPT